MVPPERFELPTPGFVIQCSIQLSQGGEKQSRGSLTGQTLSQSEWRMDLTWLRWLDSNQRFLAYETKRMTTSIHRDNMVPNVWFEQTTYRLQGDCATTTLIGLLFYCLAPSVRFELT